MHALGPIPPDLHSHSHSHSRSQHIAVAVGRMPASLVVAVGRPEGVAAFPVARAGIIVAVHDVLGHPPGFQEELGVFVVFSDLVRHVAVPGVVVVIGGVALAGIDVAVVVVAELLVAVVFGGGLVQKGLVRQRPVGVAVLPVFGAVSAAGARAILVLFLAVEHHIHGKEGAERSAAKQQQQEDEPQQVLVPALRLLFRFHVVEFRDVDVVGRLVVRGDAVQEIVVGPRDEQRRPDLVLVKGVSRVDLAVSDPQNALVLGRVWDVGPRVVQKLPAPGDRGAALVFIGALSGQGRWVVDPVQVGFVFDVGVLRAFPASPDVGRDAKAHARDLGIQVPVEGVVCLPLVGSGVPNIALYDDAIVVGLGVVADGPQVGKAYEPIGGWRDLRHGRQERVCVGHIDGRELLRFGGVEHALSDDHMEGFEPRVLELVVHDAIRTKNKTHLRKILHTGGDGLRPRPHAPVLGMANDGWGAPGRGLGEIFGVPLSAPLAPEGAVVPEVTGVVLVDVAEFEFLDPERLLSPCSRGFVELG
ncbi:unnamed protein product [Pseudo-nitzschia multistriata]|uniref:Uncharacterized protein n=1 Tax=Pseudo-nitzschia multistriata TaxID=183589 RepID=A0A448ZS02_9STRA|nr:unnamed protein product [Pseudo-nitzschia multistriata]